MTKEELKDAFRLTFEWEIYKAKERIWSELHGKADEYAEKADEAQTATFDALAALYATDEYKAWSEAQDD